MSDWALKRFWSAVDVAPEGTGWTVTLDGRRVRTPGRAPLVLATEALARAVAEEWAAQEGAVRPATMPLTRAANSAIDKVTPQRAEVAGMLAGYGGTDLLCYRAEAPEALAARQAEEWDPLLAWARDRLGAHLVVTAGLVPVAQPAPALAALRARIDALDVFALTALHDLVTLSGSLVIGLAALEEAWPAEELWRRARLDEDWQESLWGRDAEAERAGEERRRAFLDAARLHALARQAA